MSTITTADDSSVDNQVFESPLCSGSACGSLPQPEVPSESSEDEEYTAPQKERARCHDNNEDDSSQGSSRGRVRRHGRGCGRGGTTKRGAGASQRHSQGGRSSTQINSDSSSNQKSSGYVFLYHVFARGVTGSRGVITCILLHAHAC